MGHLDKEYRKQIVISPRLSNVARVEGALLVWPTDDGAGLIEVEDHDFQASTELALTHINFLTRHGPYKNVMARSFQENRLKAGLATASYLSMERDFFDTLNNLNIILKKASRISEKKHSSKI